MGAHHWILPEAIVGISVEFVNICIDGLWSVLISKLLSHKYWWYFFTPKTIAKASLSNCEYFCSDFARVCEARVFRCCLTFIVRGLLPADKEKHHTTEHGENYRQSERALGSTGANPSLLGTLPSDSSPHSIVSLLATECRVVSVVVSSGRNFP